MVEAVPEGSLLVLDEAYVELAPEGTAPALDPADPRVIRMRTFSKAHGLAGARVGYAIGAPGLIAAFDKVRNHFGMCRVSQAGALAALQDRTWAAYMQRLIGAARDRIGAIARENGLTPLPSATNFVAVDCGNDGTFARAVLEALTEEGVFVRMPGVAPQNRCIRISCAPEPELEVLARALPRALARARAASSR
jgi:histidinol-phosphate aminotransferase